MAGKLARGGKGRLKVFQAQFGFYDSVVAAPSQVAALRAWGTHQNLFAGGDARVTTDEAAVKAALEHQEVPLRRPVGSHDPFEVDPAGLPKAPDAPKRAGKSKLAPDRSKLKAAEAALNRLEQRRQAEEAGFDEAAAALAARRDEAKTAYAGARKDALATVAAARKAYTRAGGVD